MPLPSGSGARLAKQLAGLRAANDTVTWKGTAYAAIVKSYEERAVPDFVPQGPGLSAGNKNGYEVSLTPSDFATTRPAVGDTLIWQGLSLTVGRFVPVVFGANIVALRYIVYQPPTSNPTADDAAQTAKWG